MSKYLTSLISETAKGISKKKNCERKVADKIGKISMFSDFNENEEEE
jgi:hypothetical protein